MRRHVLFLTYHLPSSEEPGASRPWMEAKLMARAGLDVTVVTSGVHYMTGASTQPQRRWCSEELVDGIRILKVWAPSGHRRSIVRRMMNYLSFALLAAVASLFKVRRVDAVFAGTDPIFVMPVVYLLATAKRARLVLDERDLYPDTAIALGIARSGRVTRAMFTMQQFFRRRADTLLAATPGIRRRLIEYGHSDSKIRLLYNADVYLDAEAEKEATGFDLRAMVGRRFLVGFAGGLGQANELMTLLAAAERLRDLPELGIVIIGAGERLAEYRRYCADRGIASVHFLGPFSRRETRSLVRQFDLGYQGLPSSPHFSNTLTSKAFDYHALGVPMVFCGQGDNVDLLDESGGGLTVASRDVDGLVAAIRRCYGGRQRLAEMGSSARRWFESHVRIDTATQTIAECLGAAAAGPAAELRSEEGRIRSTYAQRERCGKSRLYRWHRQSANYDAYRQRAAWIRAFSDIELTDLSHLDVLDVGCGSGTWLRQLVEWGADPLRLHGIDLLFDRIEEATQRSMSQIDFRCASAWPLPHESDSMDVIAASTVFSSVRSAHARSELAKEIVRVVRPGGHVLIYDFQVSHPRNNQTVGIRSNEIRRLFPQLKYVRRYRLTAPPQLTRRLPAWALWLPHLFESLFPFLCTHALWVLRLPQAAAHVDDPGDLRAAA